MVVSRGMLAEPCKSARKCARMQGIPAGYVFLVTIKNLILLLRSHIFFVLRWSRGPHDGWCVHIGVIFFRVGSILTQCNYTVTTYSCHQKSHITVALIYIFCVALVAWSAWWMMCSYWSNFFSGRIHSHSMQLHCNYLQLPSKISYYCCAHIYFLCCVGRVVRVEVFILMVV